MGEPEPDESTSTFLRRNPEGHTEFLLGKAKDGSNAAWDALFSRYRTMLVVYVQSRPGFARLRLTPEEVVAIVFSKAWLNIQSFEYRSEGCIRGWLRTIAWNEIPNLLKKQQAEEDRVSTESRVSDLPQQEYKNAKAREERELTRADVLEQLRHLSDEHQEVLTMRIFEGMTFERMAEILECSPTKVRSLYGEAIEELRKRLSQGQP